ncbi:MAG: host attachment protein [Isosphaeraceae bacterium]
MPMMPITRKGIEILLDTPDQRDYVLSAYADLTLKDGFNSDVGVQLKNVARTAAEALGDAKARKTLDANFEAVLRAIREQDPSVRGLAVFTSVERGLHHVVPLGYAVPNRIVLDEDLYVLPLLEHWYGEPSYLVAVVNSDEAHLFEAFSGVVAPAVKNLERPDIDADIQRDKPRFTYKKRFAQTRHESLQEPSHDKFLLQVAETINEHFRPGEFTGLILLGQPHLLGPLRSLLHKDVQAAVVEEAQQAMTTKPGDIAREVARTVERWHADRDRQLLDELSHRWKEGHLVANGPTDVLDALQQGRTAQIVIGTTRNLPGARCTACGYRFGVVVATCPYCQGPCRTVNAVQAILRMALRHRTPVHLLRPGPDKSDPLARVNGLAALLRAEANWAPDPVTAQASQGH